ncbi:MAG: DNA-processing protein DprA [Cycloclasticus sp.]|nr:DNA-processing protein DprA [Cycloclasticus sp.]MBQ0789077.1 DNA-processing protein DprA [Cycloclasticus sp.]
MSQTEQPDEGIPSSGFVANEQRHWLTLWRVKGVGAKNFISLLDVFSHPKRVLAASLSELKNAGVSAELAGRIQRIDPSEADADIKWLENDDCHLMCWHDDDYPGLLKEIHDPPPVLFIRGDRSLLSSLQIAIVGTRNPSALGLKTTRAFANSFTAMGLTVTSGLALGIDQAAHQGAIDISGKTIAVAATGLDRVYPASNRGLAEKIIVTGALVSEFPIETHPQAGYFPRRNRIISGLSLGVLVVEATIKSGTLVTARHAIEQGREVFAMPGSIHNPQAKGCHYLIRQGAKLVETAEDVLEDLGALSLAATSKPLVMNEQVSAKTCSLGDDYFKLLEKIAFAPTSVDDLIEATNFTAEEISSMLLVLELEGLVLSSPGGFFCRC